MSRRSDQKKARRRKRQAARNDSWVPARVAQQLEIAADLEDFDARLSGRGWEFAEDTDDETGVAWYWPPSAADVDDEDDQVSATVVLLTPDDEGEIAHVVFVGTSDDYQFNLEELFDHIETIEAYRLGEPIPAFG
ncbi:hypothetical protein Mycch_0457 [Mycolicibacterium chubuense NBB4]|uniref:Uncharacterized protein n=1 Tax=Mycolicibacterium chubuense (strain NBB4) TaxID=710421 RepID=I4BDC0_MYCCN|nr:hypothetical protein [Mycolicibacterium chubuense]AFM15277.1 hypothetical protein Mycch_0457 [Mycolicibacterium chubuense NBB4]